MMALKKIVGREKGFTLIELLVTMAVFVLSLVLVSNFFTGQLALFKQQSKITETNIEGALGLDIMRQDIENGGVGLPWALSGATYCEAAADSSTTQDDTSYNDTNAACDTSNPPRAFVSGGGDGLNGSDVLVIKATSVGTSAAAQKWTHVFSGNTVTEWSPAGERMGTDDRVIVINPGTSGATRNLVVVGGSFTTRYDAGTTPDSLENASFAPGSDSSVSMAYGVTGPAATVTDALRMPFNRADYYIRTPANMPQRCASGTGILYKGTVNQGDGGHTELPVLDCVADMRVLYVLDRNIDGTNDAVTDDITTSPINLSASDIRDQLREVRVYILAHEGQRDPGFSYSSSTVSIGEAITLGGTTYDFRRSVDLATRVGAGWQNYRWKIYTLVVKLNNLGRQIGTT